LLGYEAGLRVSEAINFDLNSKTRQGLYRLAPTKKHKERFVYIPKSIIKELKKHD
jgi:site-specific recombinase XerD